MSRKTLEEVRAEVEKIDEQIIELIAMRTKLAEEILAAKREAKVEIDDPEQVKKVLRRAVDKAKARKLDARAVERIFEVLVEMNIHKQKELMRSL
jgi:chorismate mutase